MPFIKVPLDYRTLPKIQNYMKSVVSKDPAATMPIVCAALAAANDPRGASLPYPSATALEIVCGWHGRPGRGVEAMINAGLIEKVEGGYRFLGWDGGWDQEQGHILKFRERARKAGKASQRRVLVEATS